MKGRILTRDEVIAAQWDDFVLQSPQGAVYATTSWLDLVSPEWSAVVVEGHQGWQAVLPMCIQRRMYGTVLTQPPFSQHLGPLFRNTITLKPVTQAEQQVEILRELRATLPDNLAYISIACAPESGPMIPFHWHGYRLETRYTYRLPLQGGADNLWEGMHSKKRNSIRKGHQSIEKINLAYHEDALNVSLHQAVYLSDKQKSILKQIARRGTDSGNVLQISAFNQAGAASGVVLVALFRNTAYLIYQQWILADQRGIMDALIWAGILAAKDQGMTCFDFEGSMLESVEKVFREFGAETAPYLVLELDRRPAWFRFANRFRSGR